MSKKNLTVGFATLLFILTVFVISPYIPNQATSRPGKRELLFPKYTNYYSLVNVNGNVTVLVQEEGSANLAAYAQEGSSNFVRFKLPDDPNCFQTFYDAYETRPDGQLQIWERCAGGNGTKIYLLAYDWKTHQLTKIAGPLPLGTSGASWNPDQTKAIGYLTSGFTTDTLFWIWNNGFGPLDLVIGDKNHSWNLKDDFPDFPTGDTGKTGSTGRAAWSPDGKRIAFFASPDAISKTSFSKFGAEYNLYLMDPNKLTTTVAFDNIYSPYVLAWSPNSKNIAFIGEYGFLKKYGIWLYSLETNTVSLVSAGNFNSLLWRPDGKKMIAVSCTEDYRCSHIEEYDVTNIMNH